MSPAQAILHGTQSPDSSKGEKKGSMAIVPRIVIYGASGMSAASAHNFAHGFSRPICEVAAYIDDFRGGLGHHLDGIPIISFDEWKNNFRDLACYVAVADPKSRRRLVEKILAGGGKFQRFYEPAEVAIPGVSIDAGTSIFMPNSIYPPNTKIGCHVQVLPMCSIGHDVTIGDYVTICPSCTISGYVVIEEEVFAGAGATVVNGTQERPLVIGAGARISAGAVVTKSIPAEASVAGNPARTLRELARARKARE
jgi:sugar O-acyltransferase (sialic acid O-acetyltransferase NeuD family)